MKSLIISVIIGALMVWGSIEYTKSLDNIASTLTSYNDVVKECIDKSDFDGAAQNIEKISEYIDLKRKLLNITGKHAEMDEIEITIAEMKSYNHSQIKEDVLAKCNSLDFLINHLPKNFKLRIENIL